MKALFQVPKNAAEDKKKPAKKRAKKTSVYAAFLEWDVSAKSFRSWDEGGTGTI